MSKYAHDLDARVNLRLPDDLLVKVSDAAREQSVGVAEMIRRILTTHFVIEAEMKEIAKALDETFIASVTGKTEL